MYFCATRLDASGGKDLAFGPDGTGTITFDRFFAPGFTTSESLSYGAFDPTSTNSIGAAAA